MGTTREQLGADLKRIRLAQGLLQADVAKGMGISQSRVSRIERGFIGQLDTAIAYATACGVSISLEPTGQIAAATSASEDDQSEIRSLFYGRRSGDAD